MAKDFDFEKHPWESFLFLDIETVAKVKELEEDTPLYDSFVYKMRYAEEAQRKDFNAYNVKALFSEKAALYPEFGKVIAITVGKIINGKAVLHTFNGHDEYDVLSKFMAALNNWVAADPELAICGVNIKFFDLRFMYIRSVINQIRPVKGHISFTGFKPWEIKVADITDVWKQTSMYNAPLVCMAECLGLPSPKADIDGSQVSSVYWKEGDAGLARIVEYCERDVLTTMNIARKLRFEPILELAEKATTTKAPKAAATKTKAVKEAPTKAAPKKTKATKKEVEKVAPAGIIEVDVMGMDMSLPPLFKRSLNTGHITEEDEKILIKAARRSTKLERDRLIEIVKAVYGKEEVDEHLIHQIQTSK